MGELQTNRKFGLAVFVLFFSPVLLIYGYISADLYSELTLWAMALYFGANVTTKIGSAKYGV